MTFVQSNVDWQSSKNTILERNRHMFNNPDMSDISFTCEGSDTIFYAHRYVLCTSSAVFDAMFNGGLAVKDSTVHLPDTDQDCFEQLLRFLYTEECTLTMENIAGTFDLANKYILPSLSKVCVDFQVTNFTPENVLTSLDLATLYANTELEERCWLFIQFNATEVVASHGFNNISRTTMYKLLKRDYLHIKEVELFQAALHWIDFQCSLKNLETTSVNRRSIIGRLVHEFRFFTMTNAEFVEHVSKSGLLTAEEMIPIFEKFSGFNSSELKWNRPNRFTGNMVRFSRFDRPNESQPHVGRWWKADGTPNRLRLSVDKNVMLLGVVLYGDENDSDYAVNFRVKDASVTGTYTSEVDEDGMPCFAVMLPNPVMLNQNEIVTLSATITGPDSYCGDRTEALRIVTYNGVSVTFSDAPMPNNKTSISYGQFREVLVAIS
ncbi:BTB/POZ domain-containing protein 2-like [Dendronephthya gigantea]|uniref:BTB/POZ domain-containing protein 2-like n=1 Tax=Dendronephthya gigantea TaxID=151771 RepID=UPI00106D4F79|nr:BTB/POZ domain-containing protein 2-like [Dendronephthya gigantea]